MKKFSHFFTVGFREFLFAIKLMKRSGVECGIDQTEAHSKTETPVIDALVTRITCLLEEHHIYKCPDLDLKKLSERVEVPAYRVTRAINEGLGVNFYDLINRYRVEAVKSMLMSDAHERFTLVSVAYDAGFKSKTTFNAAFKKITGLTPSSYRNQLRATLNTNTKRIQ